MSSSSFSTNTFLAGCSLQISLRGCVKRGRLTGLANKILLPPLAASAKKNIGQIKVKLMDAYIQEDDVFHRDVFLGISIEQSPKTC